MIISRTPLRISFAGGGTDFPDYYKTSYGAVVSAAIDKYIHVIVNPRFDNKIRVAYTRTEIVDCVEAIEHEIVRECLRYVGVKRGIEIATMADIPSEGSGLGSSSTLTVGLLNALHAYAGHWVNPMKLAEQACEIEIDILGKPIGKQDQYIAALGSLRHIRFHNDGSVTTAWKEPRRNLGWQELSDNLLLFFTGATRQASAILYEQRSHISEKMGTLDTMRDDAARLFHDLNRGDIETVGRAINSGWHLKRSLASGISNPEIDQIWQSAMDAGAIGAKVTGAGGGGFFLVYAKPEKHPAIRSTLSHLQELKFNIGVGGTQIIFRDGGIR